jgi:hypothetical protein
VHARQRRHAQFGGPLRRGDEHRGGPVGDLRRVARRDLAAIEERRLQRRQLLHRRPTPDSLVGGDIAGLGAYGNDLVDEEPAVLRRGRALVRFDRVLVELGAGKPILFGDQFGARPLVEPSVEARCRQLGRVPFDGGPAHLASTGHRGGAHRHAGHHLHASGDDDVGLPGHHGRRGRRDGLLRRSTLPVDREARHRFRPSGGEDRHATNVAGLLADADDVAPVHILDERGIHPRPRNHFVEHHGREFDGMHTRQTAVALAYRCPHGSGDDRISHRECPSQLESVQFITYFVHHLGRRAPSGLSSE